MALNREMMAETASKYTRKDSLICTFKDRRTILRILSEVVTFKDFESIVVFQVFSCLHRHFKNIFSKCYLKFISTIFSQLTDAFNLLKSILTQFNSPLLLWKSR